MSGKLKKPLLVLMLMAMFSMVLGGTVFAKNGDDDDRDHRGGDDRRSEQKASITAATAISMIVNGMHLNIDNMRFIKEPKASDYFTRVKDNAPYAQAFIIAHLNGLDVPRNIDPAAKVTREQFSHWLLQAINRTGEYAWVEIFIQMADAKLVNKAYMESVQKVLIAKIASLDSKKNFRPKQLITRGDATSMLTRAIAFVKKMTPIPPVPANPETTILKDIRMNTEFAWNDVVRVTISATVPHPGYGIDISGIQFRGDKAVINYRVIMPDPAAFYAQVITEVKAVAYISAKYTPVLGEQDPSVPHPSQSVSVRKRG
ncbi:S-layer homology domain-containing protein [Cohnella kolymensis]|uniref:S-layer homology domain-containing protein n=1 Tax=Cohnella kolymensis TaxID=1590652 RepID=UPI000695AD69|nr:S-layer homology domain-containing protein [Cohnella kolymensis]